MTLQDVKLLKLPKVLDERGNLSFFENEKQIPFSIARAYWIYDVPGGEIRGFLILCPTVNVSIPNAFALPNGTLANTVYPACAPASSLMLQANVTGGAMPYSYTWSPTGATTSSVTVSPTTTTTYSVSV